MIGDALRIASHSLTLSHYVGFVDLFSAQQLVFGFLTTAPKSTFATLGPVSGADDASPGASSETIVRFQRKAAKAVAISSVASGVEPDAGLKSQVPAKQADNGVREGVREVGGRKDGTDPTRYGDWEKNGRCIDF